MLVPLAGLATAPVLAHALGVEGRGLAAAAIAPNVLIVGVATLGLPEALTYFVAKQERLRRSGLWWSMAATAVAGGVCLVGCVLALDFLSDGDPQLADLILLGALLAIPQLVVNLLRGVASGRQLWRVVAAERLLNSGLRVVALAVLFGVGQLSVLTAVLVLSIAPILAGLVYVVLLSRADAGQTPPGLSERARPREILGFGSKVWLGAVAGMLLGRIGHILFAPLASVAELGLYTVAITVSDVPLVVALGIRDVLYGVSSKDADAERVAATARTATLLGGVGCLIIGGTLPWWIEWAFGAGFSAAVWATWILLLCAVINIPGFLAASGLGAWGRPGLRSVGLALTLAINLPLFVVLVPVWGALGAALAGLVSSAFSTVFMLASASRVMRVPLSAFWVPRASDVRRLVATSGLVLSRIRRPHAQRLE